MAAPPEETGSDRVIDRAGSLNEAAAASLRNDPRHAEAQAREALALAEVAAAPHTKATALRLIGNALLLQCRYTEALPLLHAGIEAARSARERSLEASCLNAIGVSLMRLGEFDGALDYLRAFLEMSGGIGNARARTVALTNVGAVCEELRDYPEAIRCFELAVEISANSPDDACTARMNLGVLMVLRGRFRTALKHHRVALAAMRRRNDRALEAHLLANLAKAQFLSGSRSEGMSTLVLAKHVATEVGARTQLCLAHSHAGHLHALGRDYAHAEKELLLALDMANDIGERYYQRDLHRALAALGTLCGRDAFAARHLRRYLALDRDIYRARSKVRLETTRLQLQADIDRHHAETIRRRVRRLQGTNRQLRSANDNLLRMVESASGDAANRDVGERGSTEVPPAHPRLAGMTGHELDLLRCLARGSTNAQIASEMGRSVYTIRDQVSVILRKLEASSRTAAVVRALDAGLL